MRRFLGIGFVRAVVLSENKSGNVQYKLIPKKCWLRFMYFSFINAVFKKQRSRNNQATEREEVFSAINDTGVKGKLWQLYNLEKYVHFTFKTTCNVKCIVQKVA